MTSEIHKKQVDREHLLRWITSIVLAPLLIFVIGVASKIWLMLFVVVATVIASWELHRILFQDESSKYHLDPFVFFSLLVPGFAYYYGIRGLLGGMLLNILACFSEGVSIYGKNDKALEKLVFRIFHVIYIPYCLAHIILLDRVWIFFVLVVIFAGDSGAFYAGRKFGKRKLCPAVSPGKTVEGAIGGFLASLILGLAFGIIFIGGKTPFEFVLIAAILNIIGQLGDLGESLIKRSRVVKDSSNILPGHGGLLDRLDSLLFAFPALYYLL
ncbi:MAG: hypothetical protein DRG59_05900 [Deltaproteobacteria bacterium]|nr:MAG: hypothetical protein DRG59_05900 [Deltaproteobacteria bacterium]